MRNVLLVTYHFPPDAGVGALRPQKFAKYLPELGWTPHVLTVHERYYSSLDPSRLADVGSAHVSRTRMLPSPWMAALGARALLFRGLGHGHVIQQKVERNALMTFAERDQVRDDLRSRLRRLVLSLGRMPDDQIGWFPPALARGMQILRGEAIDAVVTSGPPHSCHLIGLWLKRLTGKRWIAELRDPWVGNPGKPQSFHSHVSDRLEARMERAVVRATDAIVLLTDRSRDTFVQRYPAELPGKFVTITNGFDGQDFERLGAVTREPIFSIAHIGTLYFRRSPRGLLDAVSRLIQDGKIPETGIRVVFAGDVADGHLPAAPGPGLAGVVTTTGRIPHQEALAWMCRADLLCLFAQGQPEQIPAKAFEYLAAGPPILAVTGEGATADLVLKSGGSVVSDEPWAIAEAIHQQYLAWRAEGRASRLERPWARAESLPFDRKSLTGRLASLLSGERV
jgi:glycosyltransferase involved in cell wall biosynthesis